MNSCPSCGGEFDPGTAQYNDSGVLVCVRCKSSEDVAIGDHRAADTILGMAGGGLALASVSVCFNPLLILSGIAFLSSMGSILTLLRHPEYHAYMGWKVAATWVLGIIGMLVALIRPGLFLLTLMLGYG